MSNESPLLPGDFLYDEHGRKYEVLASTPINLGSSNEPLPVQFVEIVVNDHGTEVTQE